MTSPAAASDPEREALELALVAVLQAMRAKGLVTDRVRLVLDLPVELAKGSQGPDVARWQAVVGVLADGDFGALTEAATGRWMTLHGVSGPPRVTRAMWEAATALRFVFEGDRCHAFGRDLDAATAHRDALSRVW